MTRAVVSVAPDTPIREVARMLREHGISAVPVVDSSGAAVGMVSEGDLIGRAEADRDARRDWWLAMLAEGAQLSSEFLATLRHDGRRARAVMTAPLLTVGENAELGEIARLLTAYRIKRVPVVDGGQVVGIVSRADLIGVLAAQPGEDHAPAAPAGGGFLAEVVAGIERRFRHGETSPAAAPPHAAAAPAPPGFSAEDFRHLVTDHERQEAQERQEHAQAAAEQRRHRVAQLIDQHISEDGWRSLLHRAREAAQAGQREFLLLRFPSQLCSDGGRAINVGTADWPTKLRGEAAELYLRWERDLKPHDFRLAARMLDFPGGMPGDIGLYLVWGIE